MFISGKWSVRIPGSFFPAIFRDGIFGKREKKAASLVTVENGRVADVTHHDLDVLRFCMARVGLSQCHHMDAVYDPVLQALEALQSHADGRILAVRLELTGESPLHMNLLSDALRLTESFRGITAGLGDMWLEKVLFKTVDKGRAKKISGEITGEMTGEETPLGNIMAAVDQLKWDPEQLQDPLSSQISDIAALKSKLPPDLLGSDDPLIPNRPEKIIDLLNDVKALLAARLSRQENLP